jgi:AraC-like DNA-binding protein
MAERQVVLPGAHPFWAPSVANVFQMLEVGAAISDGALWRPIHTEPSITGFELEHGVELGRDRYNARCLMRARKQREPILGSHAGYSDWFVPIVLQGRVEAFLVVGPFATARPRSTDILERWGGLTGLQQGHPADPEFARYVSMSLAVLTLRDSQVTDLRRLLVLLCALMVGEKPARPVLGQIDAIWPRLEEARLVERIWSAAHEMIDERTARRWSRPHEARGRALLGLPRAPDQALVGLIVSQHAEPEAVDAMLRRDAFQRQCVTLARKSGYAISGRVGDHGVTFLAADTGSAQRKRQRLSALNDRAADLAKRFGFRWHGGMCSLPASTPLPRHYQAALQAAEAALSEGVRLVSSLDPDALPKRPLDEMRRDLAKLVEERPSELSARFDRYLEAVARHCTYRLEPARAHLDAALDRMVDKLRESGAFEQKSFAEMLGELERRSREARTINELFATFRLTIADIADAVRQPRSAHQDRSVRRAIAYVREHYSEPLSLRSVARVAGFAPNYFSVLFKKREKMTFERYLRQLRIERAKELLATTDLAIERIAKLSGLGSRQYMARVFQRNVGTTPRASRHALRPRAVI